ARRSMGLKRYASSDSGGSLAASARAALTCAPREAPMLAPSLFLLLASQPPAATIDAPRSGWTTERIVTVTGHVENAATLGTLNVNGVERPLPLQGGQFSATFALGRGENAIEVIAPPSAGKGDPARARILLYAQIPRVDLQ